ncbi:hypothetical protein Q4567_01805 [Aliiglaciecola sp. 2_MG-2023]|uniref:hypothetical protein n=1 Tax=Alteromonadaceae TaxID=72275 RepID=UPI0026E4300F|nr:MULTISPECIES: hypothetical protein [unclassified Aliiglaciecola]MDO6709448.1 hypothetical protein [Aliiglaciecola sp. 2_MG-2023]MDO6750596.1 hypothetical protein [Aliiglaciecola sp. 1_MG-2023]
MKKLTLLLLGCFIGLAGCEITPKEAVPVTQVILPEQNKFCLFVADSAVEHNCELTYWLDFWVEHDTLSWTQRKELINQLGDSTGELMKKVLLSQGKGTPYQNRLRAQGWADDLIPSLTEQMKQLLFVLVYRPSQELLEFESALTILTRMNTNQSKELDVQQQRLFEQQQQIDQLLKIEASMMEKKEGISQ